MSDDRTPDPPPPPNRGYGNIYTPHAGSMVIQVQREGGLANRTIVLDERQVRLLKFLNSKAGLLFAVVILASYLFFAIQAVRVPVMSRQIATLEHDVSKIDTLHFALIQAQRRYAQLQRMLGISTTRPKAGAPESAARLAWPVSPDARLMSQTAADSGVLLALPLGSEVRAAGAGRVVELSENARLGTTLVVLGANKVESRYGHLGKALVPQGDSVAPGQVIALSGNSGATSVPALFFAVRQDGRPINPMQFLKKD